METGRNDPCPCGSGRKYKQCCLARVELVDARWRAWRGAEGTVMPAALAFARDLWGAEFIEGAMKAFFDGSFPAEETVLYEAWQQLFLPWLALDYVAKPTWSAPRRRWPTVPPAAIYLEQHGAHLPAAQVRVLRAGLEAPLSFMAVTAVQPGLGLTLSDILTGESHGVIERSASTGLQPGHVVLARVISDGDISIMSGLGPIPLFPQDHQVVINFREAVLRPRGLADRAGVRRMTSEVLALYHRLVYQALHPKPPELQNTDGDPIAPTTLEFELRCPVREAFDRLAALSVHYSTEELLDDAQRSEAGELTGVEIVWSKEGNRLHRDWDNTTLGTVRISAGSITGSVNSAKRAKRLRRLIEKHLGRGVLFLRQTEKSVEAMLDAAAASADEGRATPDATSLDDTAEGRAVLEAITRRHWEGWLDTEIPALGNQTPRRAAKTQLGRERVEALLANYTFHQANNPNNQIALDMEWIRSELGLPASAC